MVKGKSNAKRNAKFARGKVDKAQTKLIQANSKAINELMGETEDKYTITAGAQVGVSYPDMSNTAGRRINIVPVPIGDIQGTTDNTRIGDRVSLKTIQLRYALNLANGVVAGADTYNRVRCIMFWDNQPTSFPTSGLPGRNPPEWTQIFQSIPIGLAQSPQLVALSTYQNDQFPARFTKVYDQVHTLASNGNVSTGVGTGARSVTGDVKFLKRYASRKISYNASGQVAMNRQLYFAFISDSTIVAHPFIDYFIKTTYTDS